MMRRLVYILVLLAGGAMAEQYILANRQGVDSNRVFLDEKMVWTNYQSAVLWMPFASATSFTNDFSKYANDGTAGGDASWTNLVGGALTLDGTGDYVDCDDIDALDAGNLTIAFWAKANNSGAIISKDYRNFEITIGATEFQGFCGEDDGGLYWVNIAGTEHGVTRSNWNHYAYVFDYGNDQILLYANGQHKGTETDGGDYIHYITDTPLYIGRRGAGSLELDGQLDDIRIYDTVLSGTVISNQLYNATKEKYE